MSDERIKTLEKAIDQLHIDVENLRQERDRAREECGHEKHMRKFSSDETAQWVRKWMDHEKVCKGVVSASAGTPQGHVDDGQPGAEAKAGPDTPDISALPVVPADDAEADSPRPVWNPRPVWLPPDAPRGNRKAADESSTDLAKARSGAGAPDCTPVETEALASPHLSAPALSVADVSPDWPALDPLSEIRALHGFLHHIAHAVGLGPHIESYDDVCSAVDRLAAVSAPTDEMMDAVRGVTSALLAVQGSLMTPYPDDSRWSPWTRFVEPAVDRLHLATNFLGAADKATAVTEGQ